MQSHFLERLAPDPLGSHFQRPLHTHGRQRLGPCSSTYESMGWLALAVMRTVISGIAAFPIAIAIAIALGRRSGLPVLSFVYMLYVELIEVDH